jgi:hypothetical protein
VGVTHHRVRDAAHQSPPHTPAPSTAHDDEPSPYLLGHPHNLLGPMTFAYRVNYLQVPLSDLAPCLLYFLDLLLENFLRLGAELLDHLRDVDVNGWIAGATVTTCNAESVVVAISTAVVRASSASWEPSVASRIVVGKMLIAILSFPVGTPWRYLCLLYQERWSAQGNGDGTTPFYKGYRGLFTGVRGIGFLGTNFA